NTNVVSNRGDNAGEWTTSSRLFWSKTVTLVVRSDTNRVVLPMLTRNSHESWREEALGVPLQFDCKTEESVLSEHSLTAYLPFAVDSFSWRYSPTPGQTFNGRFAKILDTGYTALAQVVTRPAGFNAAEHRRSKEFWMGMIISNCAETG